MAALDALERRATAANAALTRSLSGANVTVNTSAAQQSLGAVTTKAEQARAAANFTATPRVDTQQAQGALGQLGGGFKQLFALGAGAAGLSIGLGAVHEALSGVVGVTLEAQQAQRALTSTYGSGAQELRAFADTQAAALGRTSVEFEQAANVAGSLSRNYGITNEQIKQLISRSADLAALHGGTVPDAMKRVEAALRGEAESAEVLGLTLNSDAVKAMASMTEEQRKNFESLDQVTKAQIIYNEFMRQSEVAQGAAKEQSQSLQGALDHLGASAAQTGADLGNQLAPGVADFVNQVSRGLDRVNAFAKAVGGLQEAINANPQLSALHQRPETMPVAATGDRGASQAELAADANRDAQEAARKALQERNEAARQAAHLAALASATANARQIELAGVQKLYQDEAAAEKTNETARKTSINAVRDAAIAAASARRDSSIAALDAEQTATSRARALQDRDIETSNQATLRGLEEVHSANIKGLDEQLTAMQKRGDEALKGIDGEIRAIDKRRDSAIRGIDQEIRAVDRKRDSALRALDEETRAESRRHSEAVRNIDLEKDRRLGIIDEELKKLDAAAQRDQRRQTDQSLQRVLADAERDRKQADTPEERRRADRAVADAKAAIAREEANRRREDARARLQDAADQVRLAADTAKKVEDARNRSTTDTLGERKLGITDATKATTDRLNERKRELDEQVQADTDRLNAIKDRIKTETDIEAQSIKDRVTAENEGYQQTVRDQQAAFKQQADALADQRYNEDQAVAGRRTAIQTAYANDAADAKASADAQVAHQEAITKATLDEIEKRRKAAEQALLPPVTIAPSSQPGLPPTHAGTDSTYGPFDPQGYDSTFGPFDPAGYMDAAKQAGQAAAEGFAAGIGSPESVAAATAATDRLIQDGVIGRTKTLLGIASPSTVFEGFGADTGQGFLNGYDATALEAAIRKPFEESIRWMAGVPDHWRTSGNDTAAAWQVSYQAYDLFAIGRQPFESLRDWISPGFANLMASNGANAGRAWQNGYAANDIFAVGRRPFELLDQWMAGVPPRFQFVGQNSGISMVVGITNGLRAALAVHQRVWEESFNQIGGSLAISLTNGFNGWLDAAPLQQPPFSSGAAYPDESRILRRAGGGAFDAWQPMLVGEQGPEIVTFPRAGAVLPADVSRNVLASASSGGQAIGGVVGNRNLALTVNINATGADIGNPQAFANRIQLETVRAVVNLLDQAERGAVDPAPMTLGGA